MKDEEEVTNTEEQAPEVVAWKTVEETNENSQPTVGTFKIVDENAPIVAPVAEEAKVEEVVVEENKTDEIAKEEENVIEEEVQVEVKNEIDEAKVLEFLKTQKGFKGETLDSLTPKEERKLSATAEAFQKYVDETNNDSFEDFVALQKDWSKEDPNTVLKMKMKMDRPHLSNEDIDLLFEDSYITEELDEYATESEIKQNRLKEIKLKDDYQEALKQIESQKEKYKVVRGADENIPASAV